MRRCLRCFLGRAGCSGLKLAWLSASEGVDEARLSLVRLPDDTDVGKAMDIADGFSTVVDLLFADFTIRLGAPVLGEAGWLLVCN